jgi:hypothetical protein
MMRDEHDLDFFILPPQEPVHPEEERPRTVLFERAHGAAFATPQMNNDYLLAFNYANKAFITSRDGDRRGNDLDFKDYLGNLVAADMIEKPTLNSKPIINVVVHSMGGLITRSMYELGTNSPVHIQKLVTIATPHFGTFIDLADWIPWNATYDLDRDSHLYGKLGEDSQQNMLGQSELPKTSYYFMIGARLNRDRKWNPFDDSNYKETPSFILGPDLTNLDPRKKSQPYQSLVENQLDQYSDGVKYRVATNDDAVSLNSGLGYSGSKDADNVKGNQVLKAERYIFVGPEDNINGLYNGVDHSPIHDNSSVHTEAMKILFLK